MKKGVLYKILSYIFLFFMFSILGYLWEVVIKLINMGILVNSGTLYGPWLPIYGFGGLMVLFFFGRFKERPIVVFFLSMITCCIIEYLASFILEEIYGMRWWDYSNYFMNLNGRICLEGAIIFGLAGCFVVYFGEPFLMRLFNKMPHILMVCLCVLFSLTFILDIVYSCQNPNIGRGVTFDNVKT